MNLFFQPDTQEQCNPSDRCRNRKRIKTVILIILWVIFITNLNGASFQTKIIGTGSPVVLIPGLSCSSEVYTETVDWMAENHECHLITIAGFAGVPAQSQLQEQFLETVLSDLTDYISEMDQEPILIGHSLGGFLSMKLAIQKPDKVAKVIVIDSYPSMGALFYGSKFDLAFAGEMVKKQSSIMLNMPDSTYSATQAQSLATMINPPEKVELALKWSLDSDRKTVFKAYEELTVADLRGEMSKVKCPMLILQAGAGPDLDDKQWKNLNAEQYGNNKMIQIQRNTEAHHFIMYDTPDWFSSQLKAFI